MLVEKRKMLCHGFVRSSFALIICIVIASLALGSTASEVETPNAAIETPTGITVFPTDAGNLVLEEEVNLHRIVLRMASPCHNWWMAHLKNLATDGETVIGLSMEDMDGGINKGNVAKWQGLRPVMTYADPDRYETYEWFSKDAQGRWVSGDLFKQGKDSRFAGTGKVPEQTVIPPEIADQFLSADGTYWSAWREIDQAEAVANLNIFRCTQKFARPEATIAMRIPFTYTYLQQFLARLQAAKLPGVTVDEIGTTAEGRKLQVIRVDDALSADHTTITRPTILVYAQEHATEPDGSHALGGMVKWLLSDEPDAKDARASTDWLFIPILYPDSATNCIFSNGDDFVAVEPIKPEAIAYATYLVNRVDAGYAPDIAVNLHNLECNEDNNISSPLVNRIRISDARSFNTALFQNAVKLGYTAGDPRGWEHGIMGRRLYGWCYRRFRTFDLAFELNTRSPQSRLSPKRSQELGQLLAQHLVRYAQSQEFATVFQEIADFLREREKNRDAWWKQEGRDRNHRNLYDLFTLGY